MSTSSPLSPALDGALRSFQNRYGHRVAYYKSRWSAAVPAEARPLVLIHSINAAASAYEMRPLFDHFAASRPTYALEWPGFGQSQRGKLDYGVRLYTDTLVDFLKFITNDYPAADLVALSQSAELAAVVAKDRPSLIHTLTLISPTSLGDAATPRQISPLAEKLLTKMPWSRALFRLLSSQASLGYFLQRSFVGPPDKGLLQYCQETSHQPGAEYAPWAFLSGRFAVSEVFDRVYAELRTPTLILYDKDAYTSFERLGELLLRNPWIRATRVPRTCGLPQWDSPRLTSALLTHHLQLLRRLSPQAIHESGWEPSRYRDAQLIH